MGDGEVALLRSEISDIKDSINNKLDEFGSGTDRVRVERTRVVPTSLDLDLSSIHDMIDSQTAELRKENKEMYTHVVKVIGDIRKSVKEQTKKTDLKLDALRGMIEEVVAATPKGGVTATERSYS